MKPIHSKPVFHFISHTHWDREWYLTFEQFRFRLVQLIDHLLELLDSTPEFRYFHLDAQTIIFEDYLAIRPHKRAQLERYVREGRILTGPWYVQNDVFLTSGESTIRNLMEGIRYARSIGGEMKNGYFPDHFGLIGQMPQILLGVGIDNTVFGRGYDIHKHGSPHFFWSAPDGSEVSAIYMANWYNNAQRLPTETKDLLKTFEMIKDKAFAVTEFPHYLMMNGVDHLEAQEDLPEALHILRNHYDNDYEFVHDSLPRYIDIIRRFMLENRDAFPVVSHELREGNDQSVLASTLSSRVYIKQADAECHDLIEKWLEPVSSWCSMLNLDPYDNDYMTYLWKLWMQNHPHDSICGCSHDDVHAHMMSRYASIREAGEAILDQKLEILARQIDRQRFKQEDQKLLIVNTSQSAERHVVQTELYFIREEKVNQFSIEDEQGRSVPYRIIQEADSRIRTLSPINLPNSFDCKKVVIEWTPTVPALGYAVYAVRPHQEGIVIQDQFRQSPILENEYLRAEFMPNGSFRLLDKVNNQWHDQLGMWEEQGDQGNLYVFRAADEAKRFSDDVQFSTVISNDLYEAVSYRFTWNLPEGLDIMTRTRIPNLVPCECSASFQLDKFSKQMSIKIQINNHARNHRIRYIFSSGQTMKTSIAGGQFDMVTRLPGADEEWARNAYIHPFWKMVAADYGEYGLACYAKGLHEYEMVQQGQELAVTLIRGVHAIHFSEIPLDVDDQIQGQCLGIHSFDLAVRPIAMESASHLYKEAELFHQGLKQKVLPMDELKWSSGRPWVQDTEIQSQFTRVDPNENKPPLPLSAKMFDIQGDVILSALKGSEDGHGLVLRNYNAETEPAQVSIRCYQNMKSAFETDLLEQVTEEIELREGALHVHCLPKKIQTFKLGF
ncbi:glycosyl hydrolase-related protein [Paenibacillus sp. KQZ6P-2]|uniref:Glycosyl hydrolase-related protein n=1 Tax=Paenibacillus mangrovi TaxID=2931978 RepID=A0A9X1WU60_9BACL|nr:glycosyl hydrolase-related protein [Paenibacillus mangrovi]MCJ8013648.1 glycosyl hydrolase-related protein [Paenibacillus mangrovi]